MQAVGGVLWGGAATSVGLGPTLAGGAVLLTASLTLAIPLSINFAHSLNLDPAPLRTTLSSGCSPPESQLWSRLLLPRPLPVRAANLFPNKSAAHPPIRLNSGVGISNSNRPKQRFVSQKATLPFDPFTTRKLSASKLTSWFAFWPWRFGGRWKCGCLPRGSGLAPVNCSWKSPPSVPWTQSCRSRVAASYACALWPDQANQSPNYWRTSAWRCRPLRKLSKM